MLYNNEQLNIYSEIPDLLNTLFQLDEFRPDNLINKF